MCHRWAETTILQWLQQLRYHPRSSLIPVDFSDAQDACQLSCARSPCVDGRLLAEGSRPAPGGHADRHAQQREGGDRQPAARSPTSSRCAQDAAFDGDYAVFVHVLDPDGEKLWQDDHQPAIPTSQWKPGQTVEYTRTVFMPNYPYIGEAIIRLGLYNPATRPPAGAAAPRKRAGRNTWSARLQLLPQSENIFIIHREGWHAPEIDAEQPDVGMAVDQEDRDHLVPEPEARLRRSIWSSTRRPDLFNPPQQITVTSGGQTLATFAADSKEKTHEDDPGDRRPAGHRGYGGHRHRHRPHLQRPAAPTRVSWASGSSTRSSNRSSAGPVGTSDTSQRGG